MVFHFCSGWRAHACFTGTAAVVRRLQYATEPNITLETAIVELSEAVTVFGRLQKAIAVGSCRASP